MLLAMLVRVRSLRTATRQRLTLPLLVVVQTKFQCSAMALAGSWANSNSLGEL
jgi:hypothetical protein